MPTRGIHLRSARSRPLFGGLYRLTYERYASRWTHVPPLIRLAAPRVVLSVADSHVPRCAAYASGTKRNARGTSI